MKHVCHAAWAARGVTPRKQPARPSALQTSPSDPRPLRADALHLEGVFQQLRCRRARRRPARGGPAAAGTSPSGLARRPVRRLARGHGAGPQSVARPLHRDLSANASRKHLTADLPSTADLVANTCTGPITNAWHAPAAAPAAKRPRAPCPRWMALFVAETGVPSHERLTERRRCTSLLLLLRPCRARTLLDRPGSGRRFLMRTRPSRWGSA